MKKFVYVVLLILLALLVVNNSLTDQYIAKLKGETRMVSVNIDPLYEEIKRKAHSYEIPADNARIDPVWKAIPGYNGLKVDVEASYKKMKSSGEFNEKRLIFKQVKPDVHLENLPPSPIYRGHPEKPMISFAVNVAWGNEYLSSMLTTLRKNNVHATFFLEGRWAKNNPDLVKMISAEGHEIGNHSYSHPDMKQLSAGKIREEIQATEDVIEAITGKKSIWFAPPSGSYRDEVVKIAAEKNLGTVLWSVDTIDWKHPPPNELINRVVSKIHNGAIVLMHPTESTAKSLEQVIKEIRKRNLEINTISRLFDEERIMKKQVAN